MNCTSCSFANAPSARFCGGCGRPLTTANNEGLRQLTMLFCDVVDSTGIAHALGDEGWGELLEAYQQLCQRVVDRHDGHVAQSYGDGVLIYFGYPEAHEDDAARAVRCALDILTALREFNESRPAGTPLHVRIGAHTGRVLVRAVGSGPRQQTLALGGEPNIAAHVQAVGTPDALLVSDETWRIVRGRFRGEGQEHRLKSGEYRRLWTVTGISSADPEAQLTEYVGRQYELDTLDLLWGAVKSGVSRVVVLRGEPGIGKSRLLHEFRQHLASESPDELELRCRPDTQNSAFLPVTELIERRLGLERTLSTEVRLDRIDERLGELQITDSDAAPLLAALLSIDAGDRYPALVSSPIRRRQRTMDVLLAALQSLAVKQPTILFAEDLHWADASTLELLHLLVSPSPALPLLGLFTARPEFKPPWSGHQGAALIQLSRLDNAEVEAVARAIAHGKPLPGQVMREITARCDGVPLFVEEVVRALVDSGGLDEREFSWELKGAIRPGLIPATIDAPLTARIDRVGDARATAQLAAAIGREFSYPLLRAVSDRSEEAVGKDIDAIVGTGLAWQAPGDADTYVFRHALIQVAAYESLPPSRRQHIHQRIAAVLQQQFAADVQKHPEIVARHLSGAGDYGEACDYWLAAGQNALARMAVPEAHGHFARALEGLKKLPESRDTLSRELDLQIAIAPTLMTLYGWASPLVAEACERARTLCAELNLPEKLYAPTWGLWTNLFVGGLLDRALHTANEVLAMAIASGDPLLQVTGRHAVAYTHYYRGEWEPAIAHAEAGLSLYGTEQERALTSTFQLSSSVNLVAALGSSLWMMGHQDRGLQELARMIEIARQVNHPSALSNALGVACYMLTFHRDFPLMLRYANEVKSFARDEGWELWYAVGVMSCGWSRLHSGDRVDGLRELFEGVALFRSTQSDLMGPTVAVIHAEGLCAAERPGEALAMLRSTADTARLGHVGVLLPEVFRLMAEIHLGLGQHTEAEAAFRDAIDTAATQRAISLELRAALSYHRLLELSGRADEGLAHIRRCYAGFSDSPSQPDIARARQILDDAGRFEGASL